MTSVLITGITGQDGTLLARRFAAEGLEVHGLAASADELEAWRSAHGRDEHLHVADITDDALMASLVSDIAPAEIYHLAGISSVALSWDKPVLTGAVTGVGAVTVFEAARRAQEATGQQVRVLQASSAEIFGVPDRTPQDESTSIAPVSPYGAAKAYAHHMARVFRSRDVFVATVILYNHESPLRPQAFVTRKITAGAARIAVDGGGQLALGALDARRDWGWAQDYVDAMVAAVRHDEADDFVVATGQTHSVADFVAAAFARAGIADWQAHVVVDERFLRPADATEIVGDASKAARVLGWAPTVAFDEIVGRMVDNDLAILRENV